MSRGHAVLAAVLVAFAFPATAQAPVAPAAPPLPRVAVETTAGRFVLELETVRAPISAGNFMRYVDRHFLDGVTFYRTVKVAEHFGFVQFGTNNDPKRTLPPIKHEPTNVTGVLHGDFTLSTARLAPGTARGDFTITVGAQPSFDADPARPDNPEGYAACGRVIEGQDVVLKIFAAPNSPDATLHGAFKGEVPLAAVRIISARRMIQSAVAPMR